MSCACHCGHWYSQSHGCAGEVGSRLFRAAGNAKTGFSEPFLTLRDVSYNARWFWTTIRYGPMTTAYLCWTTGNGFKMTDLGFWTTMERGNTHRRRRK